MVQAEESQDKKDEISGNIRVRVWVSLVAGGDRKLVQQLAFVVDDHRKYAVDGPSGLVIF
jgi:hypothetical protein